MNPKWVLKLLTVVVLLIPSNVFGDEHLYIKTGYDMYSVLKKCGSGNLNKVDQDRCIKAFGYIDGYLQALLLQNDIIEEHQKKFLEYKCDGMCINLPNNGELTNGQLALIYLKWAKEHPTELSESVSSCIYLSLQEAYGVK